MAHVCRLGPQLASSYRTLTCRIAQGFCQSQDLAESIKRASLLSLVPISVLSVFNLPSLPFLPGNVQRDHSLSRLMTLLIILGAREPASNYGASILCPGQYKTVQAKASWLEPGWFQCLGPHNFSLNSVSPFIEGDIVVEEKLFSLHPY